MQINIIKVIKYLNKNKKLGLNQIYYQNLS